jgi:hypothetical protein
MVAEGKAGRARAHPVRWGHDTLRRRGSSGRMGTQHSSSSREPKERSSQTGKEQPGRRHERRDGRRDVVGVGDGGQVARACEERSYQWRRARSTARRRAGREERRC